MSLSGVLALQPDLRFISKFILSGKFTPVKYVIELIFSRVSKMENPSPGSYRKSDAAPPRRRLTRVPPGS